MGSQPWGEFERLIMPLQLPQVPSECSLLFLWKYWAPAGGWVPDVVCSQETLLQL